MRLIFFVIISALFTSLSFSQAVKDRTISVYGEASVFVTPNEVSIQTGIITLNKDIVQAKKENDVRSKKVVDLCLEQKIDKNDIQLDYLSVNPKYEYINNKREFTGYEVSKNITIVLKKIDNYESFLTKLIQNGINNIYNVNFKNSDLRKYKDEARVLAIKAAKEKADLLAGTLGLKVKKTSQISEVEINEYNYNRNMVQNLTRSDSQSESDSSIIGKKEITAKIYLVFDIE